MSPRDIVILITIFLSAWYIFPVTNYLPRLRLSDGIAFLSVVISITIAVFRSQRDTNSEETVSDLQNLPFILYEQDVFQTLQNPIGEGADGNEETVVLRYRHGNLNVYDEGDLTRSYSGEIVSNNEDLDLREEDTLAMVWTANGSYDEESKVDRSGENFLLDGKTPDHIELTSGKCTAILEKNANKICRSYSDRETLETEHNGALDVLCDDKQVKIADSCYLGKMAMCDNRSTVIMGNRANNSNTSFSDTEILKTESKGAEDVNFNGKHVELDNPVGLERIHKDSSEIITGSAEGLTGSNSAKAPSHGDYAELTCSNPVTTPSHDGSEERACSDPDTASGYEERGCSDPVTAYCSEESSCTDPITASALDDYDKALDDALEFEIQKHRANADSMKALMVALMTPEELNRQADAFIAKVKGQMVTHV